MRQSTNRIFRFSWLQYLFVPSPFARRLQRLTFIHIVDRFGPNTSRFGASFSFDSLLGAALSNVLFSRTIYRGTDENPLLASVQNHSGNVYGLDFNPFQQHLLATGGANNEVYLWDLQNPSKPSVYSPGTSTAGGTNDVTTVAWNKKVVHILATATSNGSTIIWDLRAKRPVLSFGRHRCRAIAWNPEQPTSIVTASEDDDQPVIHMWNLVNTYAPEKTLQAHTQGVLSMSWCRTDTNLLLSTGKDKRTLLWDTTTSEVISEVEISANWNFDVQWSPAVPAVASACSLDGKIRILRLNDFDTRPALPPAVSPLSNGMTQQGMNDLFGLSAGDSAFAAPASQPVNPVPVEPDNRPTGKPPKHVPVWLRRPAGASFAFGGKLIMFGKPKAPAAGPPTPAAGVDPSKVTAPAVRKNGPITIVGVVTDAELIRRADYLEAAIKSNKYQQFCDEKLKSSKTEEEKTTWSFIKATFAEKPRQEMLVHLGFEPEEVSNTLNDYIDTLPLPPGITKGVNDDSDDEDGSESAESTKSSSSENGSGGDASLAFDKAVAAATSSTKQEADAAQINLASSDPTDTMLTRALLVGDFPSAVDCCIRLGRMDDALVLAACGGGALWKRTQDIYFKLNAKKKPFVAVISSIVNKNMDDLVSRVDLARWKECLAVLCTYGAKDQFARLCTKLGDRLKGEKKNLQSASMCYICAGAIEQTLDAWIQSRANGQTLSLMQLQDLIERVVVSSKARSEFKATDYLVNKYAMYAEALATQGRLSAALYYLQQSQRLTPQPAGSPAAILFDRVYHAIHRKGSVSSKDVPPFPFDHVAVGGTAASKLASAAGKLLASAPSTAPVTSASGKKRGSVAPPEPSRLVSAPTSGPSLAWGSGGMSSITPAPASGWGSSPMPAPPASMPPPVAAASGPRSTSRSSARVTPVAPVFSGPSVPPPASSMPSPVMASPVMPSPYGSNGTSGLMPVMPSPSLPSPSPSVGTPSAVPPPGSANRAVRSKARAAPGPTAGVIPAAFVPSSPMPSSPAPTAAAPVASAAPPPMGSGRAASGSSVAPPPVGAARSVAPPPSAFVPSSTPTPAAPPATPPVKKKKKKTEDSNGETPPIKKKKKVKPADGPTAPDPVQPVAAPPPVASVAPPPSRSVPQPAVLTPSMPMPTGMSSIAPPPSFRSAVAPSPARVDPQPSTAMPVAYTTAPTQKPELPKPVAQDQQELLEKVKQAFAKIEAVEPMPDIHPRIADLNEKILSVPELAKGQAAHSCLLNFCDFILTSSLPEAKDAHQELTAQHYRVIGSKAMLGLKRMMACAEKHRL
jgi:protein transport protein SEC31